jgi:asparagine synthetase B (glutamine-hydrolysing)
MYLLSQYIAKNTDVKVILSGEGSDELFGGYLYFKYAPNDTEFRNEIIKLLNNIYLYDALRADRSTASNGLEIRPPFLDKELITCVLTSPKLIKCSKNTYEFVRNSITMFDKIYYNNGSKTDIQTLKGKIVKAIVSEKQDPVLYERWLDSIR